MGLLVRRSLAALTTLCLLPGALVGLVRLLASGTRRHRSSAAECRAALGRPAPVAGGSPLQRLAPGVFEIQRRWLAPFGSPGEPGLLVIHLLSVGEHAHAVLPGLERLCLSRRGLAAHRHLVVDTPWEAPAFESSEALAAHTWRALRPVLLQLQLPVVFVGADRAASIAFDLACRTSDLDGRRTGACLLSLPLFEPCVRPVALQYAGRMEPLIAHLLRTEPMMPAAWLRLQQRWLRQLHAVWGAFLRTELRADNRPALRWLAWDIGQRPPTLALYQLCLEARPLSRRPERIGERKAERIAEALKGRPGLYLTALWGAEDRWLPVGRCLQRCQHALSAAELPERRAHAALLAGWGHAIGREFWGDFGVLAAQLARTCDAVAAGQRTPRHSHVRLSTPTTPAVAEGAPRRPKDIPA